MSYKLEKPNEKQRLDFVVKYNHEQGLRIEEGINGTLFALEPWEKLLEEEVVDNKEEYESELSRLESERIAMLSLTAADVERAVYKAKGVDFEDILELLKDNPEVDLKALKIELKSNYFYRGNPYVDIVGALLGYSPEDLDYLFEHKELPVKNEEVNNDGMGV